MTTQFLSIIWGEIYHEALRLDTSKNQLWESEFKNLSKLITSNNAAIEDWTRHKKKLQQEIKRLHAE